MKFFFFWSFFSTREQNRLVCVCLNTVSWRRVDVVWTDPKLFWTLASYGVRWQVHVSAAITAGDRYNYIFLYTYHSWSSFHPIQRNVASIVETAVPSSLMRLDRLQRLSEIGSERKILYLCWKSNSENPLGIAGLHPLNPYHYARLPFARVSQTLRSFCLSNMI
jgi:hypothetical protein